MQFEFPTLGIHGLRLQRRCHLFGVGLQEIISYRFSTGDLTSGYYYYNILGEKKPTERMVFDVRQNLFKFDSGL